ncbi:DUF2264 domain-containing protein [Schleiferilactobacillus harbinensis]|uniref:DUF2264 domain-containing protein n=1 Tax=Schleiferilactobacillus harbinensis TaxID=304207 RepID=UPI0012399259|nr:DUF2264 domain-containing protein [Schleiferilactobacillus harbinensis]QEU48571.1 DUF2264 domain-containing protein [Schleiferilactobacillus harbinensis]
MTETLFNAQLTKNPLRSRQDALAALLDLLTPAMRVMLTEKRPGRFKLSHSGAVYTEDRTEIEGFMRLLWGLGPLFTDSEQITAHLDWWEFTTTSITTCTNPASPDFWGAPALADYDQLFVEMGALTAFLFETQADFWDHLAAKDQTNILDWLEQVNHHVIPKTNWLLFRALVNAWFVHVGHAEHKALIDADLAITNSHYLDHGWSYDGYRDQIDNYIPFAYQFFTLLFIQFTGYGDQQETLIRERATAFVKSYANWFAADGAALPFGRSLDYRFAQAAFWAACAFAHVDLPAGYTLADVKHLLLNNLRWWFKQDMFQSDGLLPVGYAYPNMNFAEGYNAPASAYWALKVFIFMALPADDPFWSAKEAETFQFEPVKTQPEPRMLVVHSKTGAEVQAFTAGQHSFEHAHAAAKYEKYVYSSSFGFSVPKGTTLLKQGAFDSTLAVSESKHFWRTAFGYADYAIHDDYVYSLWQPWPDVQIANFVVPAMPWHVRVHQIQTARTLHVAEGGFAAPDSGTPDEQELATPIPNSVFYQTPVGIVGIVAPTKDLTVTLATPEPNTNIDFPKTRIPMQTGVLLPGTHTLVTLFLGDRELESLVHGHIQVPAVQLTGNQLTIADHPITLTEWPTV